MLKYEEYVDFIKEKHKNQLRKQGTPYYLHPLEVSKILKDKKYNNNYQIAGLFHDLIEDTNTTYEEIEKISNKEITNAVRLVTKEKNYNMKEYISRINNNKMAKAVKLADRLHNIKEVKLTNKEFIKKYIEETEKWYIELSKNTVFEKDIKKELDNLKKNIQEEK